MTDQAVHSSVSGAGDAQRAASAAPAFTGRARELAALREDLGRSGLDTLAGRTPPRARVLLVAGPPGSGRTALAEEFARRVAPDHPDGVLRTRLTDPGGAVVPIERAARELLDALAVPAPPGADEDELTEALRTALRDRRAVLLLDDVAAAEQLTELLPDAPGCLVLATAEGPLSGVCGVRPCTLGPLAAGSAVALLARRAGSDIRITVDPRAAELLAEGCERHPASLVLAGGWLAAHPHASVLDAARALAATAGRGTPLERTFGLVLASLPAPAARLLRLLSLAPAGYVDPALAAGLAGCSVPAARGALQEFVRRGLLHTLPGDAYRVPGCLDGLLRAELEARERPGEVQLARARLLERALRQLHACWAVTEPPGSAPRRELAGQPRPLRFETAREAAAWLDSRLPALLAGVRLAVADGELDTLARRFVAALGRALNAHRSPERTAPEQYRLHELVLTVAERRELHRERAAALLNLGDLDAWAGRPRAALERYRTALAAVRADGGGDVAAGVRAMDSLGGTYLGLRDWQRAADWYGRALALCQNHGDQEGVARLHGRIGAVHLGAGQWGEALRSWRAAAGAYRRLRDPAAHARALAEVARAQEGAGHLHDALRTCHQARERARKADDARLEAALTLRLADACARVGDAEAAAAHRAAAGRLTDRDAGGGPGTAPAGGPLVRPRPGPPPAGGGTAGGGGGGASAAVTGNVVPQPGVSVPPGAVPRSST
ncbi:tetratricopeptide repeat protein [Streptomyces sp. TRM 70351]|uniref:tetratricopeptide repeat protein n=1 Tax=Streptomyces sp. TRM 70351 TaxID=3116552 RepID=UPI002E7C23AF|nr:tetratricopeptide repeat protein [Streptomyces sp. TRM 70351]MEE1929287.1 tetratricopeptide repeat protein [Streptomyces sp. TRM 70351]